MLVTEQEIHSVVNEDKDEKLMLTPDRGKTNAYETCSDTALFSGNSGYLSGCGIWLSVYAV